MSDPVDVRGHLSKLARTEGAIRCGICATDLHGSVIACPICQTPYHQDCFEHQGGCAVYGCRGVPAPAPPVRVQILLEGESRLRLVRTGFMALLPAALLGAWLAGPYRYDHPLAWLRSDPIQRAIPASQYVADLPGIDRIETGTRELLTSLIGEEPEFRLEDRRRRLDALATIARPDFDMRPLIPLLVATVSREYGGHSRRLGRALEALGTGESRSRGALPELGRMIQDGDPLRNLHHSWKVFDQMFRIDRDAPEVARARSSIKQGPPICHQKDSPGWRYQQTSTGAWYHAETLERVQGLLQKAERGAGPERMAAVRNLEHHTEVPEVVVPQILPLLQDPAMSPAVLRLLDMIGAPARSALADLERALDANRGRGIDRLPYINAIRSIGPDSAQFARVKARYDLMTGDVTSDPASNQVLRTTSSDHDLLRVLGSRDANRRHEALRVIASRDEPGAALVGPVIQALDDPVADCCHAAVLALRRAGPAANRSLSRVLAISRVAPAQKQAELLPAIIGLGGRSPGAVEFYREVLAAGNPSLPVLVAALRETPEVAHVLPELAQAMRSSSTALRYAIMGSWPESTPALPEETVLALVTCLEDPGTRIPAWAARILESQNLRTSRVEERLKELARAPAAELRARVQHLMEVNERTRSTSRVAAPVARPAARARSTGAGAADRRAAARPAGRSPEVPPRGPEDPVQTRLVTQVSRLLRERMFDELDTLAAGLRSDPERFASGSRKAWLISQILVEEDFRISRNPTAGRLEEWADARPRSGIARCALAHAWNMSAWSARGHGYATTVKDAQWETFRRRLVRAEALCREGLERDPNCISGHLTLLRIARAQGWDADRREATFKAAVEVEPGCLHLYVERAYDLLPRWHGRRGDWQAFALESARSLPDASGPDLYFTIVSEMLVMGGPGELDGGGLDRERALRGALETLERWKHGRNLHKACYLACILRDRELAARLFERIGSAGSRHPYRDVWDVWGKDSPEVWRRWATGS